VALVQNDDIAYAPSGRADITSAMHPVVVVRNSGWSADVDMKVRAVGMLDETPVAEGGTLVGLDTCVWMNPAMYLIEVVYTIAEPRLHAFQELPQC